MSKARNSPRKARAALKRRAFLVLRAEGKSYNEIAREMSCSKTYARKAVAEEMDRVQALTSEEAERLKAALLQRYRDLLEAWWGRATGGEFASPDKDAANVVLKGMAQLAKLAGLDAPQRVKVGSDPLEGMSEAELREEARRHGIPVLEVRPRS